MTKFAHFHFAANKDACDRLVRMGEIPDHVFDVGCPSIDAILSVEDDRSVIKKYELSQPYFLLIQHPVTSEIHQSDSQIAITLEAIKRSGVSVLVILPNNDAGYSSIVDKVRSSNIKSVDTLSINEYVNLLRHSSGLIGNSSSGIHEAASFNIPVINIGSRQQGRLRPMNVIDVDHDENEIISAIRKCQEIKAKNIKYENPYGDGKSAARIVELLKNLDISEKIVQKRITY